MSDGPLHVRVLVRWPDGETEWSVVEIGGNVTDDDEDTEFFLRLSTREELFDLVARPPDKFGGWVIDDLGDWFV